MPRDDAPSLAILISTRPLALAIAGLGRSTAMTLTLIGEPDALPNSGVWLQRREDPVG